MKRVSTKIGDVFFAALDSNRKKYFQYIANDLTQLNSDVIRVFKKAYPTSATPDLSELIKGEVEFYVHCVTKWGIQLGLWQKAGNVKDVGKVDVFFRDTNDYGSKIGDQKGTTSRNWYIWKINDEKFTPVGKLKDEYKKAFIGLVINPQGIIELLKGNKYPLNYPD